MKVTRGKKILTESKEKALAILKARVQGDFQESIRADWHKVTREVENQHSRVIKFANIWKAHYSTQQEEK